MVEVMGPGFKKQRGGIRRTTQTPTKDTGKHISTITREKNGKIITSKVTQDAKGRKTFTVVKVERALEVAAQQRIVSKVKSGKQIADQKLQH